MNQDKWLGGQDRVPWGHDKNIPLVAWAQERMPWGPFSLLRAKDKRPTTYEKMILDLLTTWTRWFGLEDIVQHVPITKRNGP